MSMATIQTMNSIDAVRPEWAFEGQDRSPAGRFIWNNGVRAISSAESVAILEGDAPRSNHSVAPEPTPVSATTLSDRQAWCVALQMIRRSAHQPDRGPGRHQIAAWVGLTAEHVVAIAQAEGLTPPHDRALRHYKSARYLSHSDRALIVEKFVAATDIADIAALVSRTRPQLLGVLRRMGLPYGRNGSMRAALLAEIASSAQHSDAAVGLRWSPPVPQPQPSPISPEKTSQCPERRRKPAHRRRKSPSSGRPRNSQCPSPVYSSARADRLLSSFVAQVGAALDSQSKARLQMVTETVYRAATNPDFRIEKPLRGIPTLLRECFSVLYVAGVSPEGCARITGTSRHVVARTFSNYDGVAASEFGRSNRSTWPEPLRPGFDLAQIGSSYGAQHFCIQKCITSGILFAVRRTEIASRRRSPHVVVPAHGFEGYAL
ncbi:hypothetical protein [Acidiphilium sp.]|uniref:hypothetical protein n=1 Tax=Acidiphilium sp. TaxID=527 RepID=UPI0025848769|nr:hypothetical protein [Acidiphilium sp.]